MIYKFTFRNNLTGLKNVPSLKNNREHNAVKLTREMYRKNEVQDLINVSRVNRPNKDTHQFITALRQRFKQTMIDEGWSIIRKPQEVAVFYDLGVFYLDELPKNDMDNALTTVQEAMFTTNGSGPILEDDCQVGADYRVRTKFVDHTLTYTKVFVMLRHSDEHRQFLEEWQKL